MILHGGGVARRFGGRTALLLAAAALAGCRGGLRGPPAASARGVGAYNFTALIQFSTRSIPFRGTVEITADTVLLAVEGLYCREVWSSFENLVYACEGATLPDVSQMAVTFDRRFPLQRPSVAAVLTISGTRSVCEQYERNETGELVCVRWRTEGVRRNELGGARLHMTRRRVGAA